jgi:hypothetical protein
MRYSIECPKCRSGMCQIYKRIDEHTVLSEVQCINRKCNYKIAFTIPLQAIEVYAPSIADKLERYACAIKV